jgi:hypothetical protein
VPIVDLHSEADSAQSSKRAHSEGLNSDFSFRTFLVSETEADILSKSKRPKRLRRDSLTHRSHTRSPLLSSKATFTADSTLQSDPSTNITLPDVRNVYVTNINNSSLSLDNQIKQKLQLNLVRFLNNELDFAGVLSEVILPTKHLYAISPYCELYSDLEFEFKNFN